MKKYLSYILLCLSLVYFIFHILQGERGLFALLKKQKELKEAESSIHILLEEKKTMERRVQLLGREVDLDMLEERVRTQLNYVYPNEKVIFQD
jgi:cell division protein FtsB